MTSDFVGLADRRCGGQDRQRGLPQQAAEDVPEAPAAGREATKAPGAAAGEGGRNRRTGTGPAGDRAKGNNRKVLKHFDVILDMESMTFLRNDATIAAEAVLGGICVVATSLPAGSIGPAGAVDWLMRKVTDCEASGETEWAIEHCEGTLTWMDGHPEECGQESRQPFGKDIKRLHGRLGGTR